MLFDTEQLRVLAVEVKFTDAKVIAVLEFGLDHGVDLGVAEPRPVIGAIAINTNERYNLDVFALRFNQRPGAVVGTVVGSDGPDTALR